MASAFDECIRLMKCQSDEEKFVGLLMVTKLTNENGFQELTPENLQLIFDAIGAKFIKRMLKTRSEQEALLSQLSLSLLSTFISRNEIARQFVDCVSRLCELLNSESLHQTRDALSCLCAIFENCADSDHINSVVVMECVLSAENLLNSKVCISKDEGMSQNDEKCDQSDESPQITLNGKVALETTDDREIKTHCVQLILAMLSHIATKCFCQLGLPVLNWRKLISIAVNFVISNQSSHKFEAMELLSTILFQAVDFNIQACDIEFEIDQNGDEQLISWVFHIRDCLEGVLKSRLTEHLRDTALTLLCTMFQVFGVDWVIFPSQNIETKSLQEKECQFLHLCLELFKIELRLLLDQQGNGLDPHFPVHFRTRNMLPVCFSALESIFRFLTSEMLMSDSSNTCASFTFDLEVLDRFRQAVNECVDVVLQYLCLASEQDYHNEEILRACIRFLGSWLAIDNDTYSIRVSSLLPFLLRIISKENLDNKECVDPSKEPLENNSSTIRFLLPYLLDRTVEEHSRTHFLQNSGLVTILNFLAQECTSVFENPILHNDISLNDSYSEDAAIVVPFLQKKSLQRLFEQSSECLHHITVAMSVVINIYCFSPPDYSLESFGVNQEQVIQYICSFSRSCKPILESFQSNNSDFFQLQSSLIVVVLYLLRSFVWSQSSESEQNRMEQVTRVIAIDEVREFLEKLILIFSVELSSPRTLITRVEQDQTLCLGISTLADCVPIFSSFWCNNLETTQNLARTASNAAIWLLEAGDSIQHSEHLKEDWRVEMEAIVHSLRLFCTRLAGISSSIKGVIKDSVLYPIE